MFHQQMTRIVLVAECDKIKLSCSNNMYRTVSFHFPAFPLCCRFPLSLGLRPRNLYGQSSAKEVFCREESFGAKWRLLLVFTRQH